MLFNSYLFWTFFAVVLALYRVLPHRGQNVLLLIASYTFYGAWDWRFLTLIWISTLVDFFVARRLSTASDTHRRRALLWVSVVTNLGLLGIFKYYNFFAESFVALGDMAGLSLAAPTWHVILPVGISFYTFQTMSYTIDVYRGECPATKSLLDFALYVCFFPQLVAGPIERSWHLMPQIAGPRQCRAADAREGLYHVLIGLFKKIVVADNLAVYVDAVFATEARELRGAECLVALYAFAFQIYCDFSGYSSIAQGLAKWMGIDLMFNFRMPYFAASPSDFWRRWHISLSTWLRDYLYVPLGGNRGSAIRTYRNLLLTMVLGGLWHGAGWTFAAWGLFHGLLLCAYRPFARNPIEGESGIPRARRRPMATMLAALVMFHWVCIGWLLFRAASIEQAWAMLRSMGIDLVPTPFAWTGLGMIAFFAGPLLLYEAWIERRGDMLRLLGAGWTWRAAVYCYLVLMMWFVPSPVRHVFIYFQF